MPYKTPVGYQRLWVYFPEAHLRDARLLAVANDRPVTHELQAALEQYLQREAAHIPRVPKTKKETAHE